MRRVGRYARYEFPRLRVKCRAIGALVTRHFVMELLAFWFAQMWLHVVLTSKSSPLWSIWPCQRVWSSISIELDVWGEQDRLDWASIWWVDLKKRCGITRAIESVLSKWSVIIRSWHQREDAASGTMKWSCYMRSKSGWRWQFLYWITN